MISEKLLLDNGGTIREYKKNQPVFIEGNQAFFYYQVNKGSVRMVSMNENGREFIQGIFKCGESFGEPVLFISEPYPASAVANEDSLVIRMNKEAFIKLLKENSDILFGCVQLLAQRVYEKSLIAKHISTTAPGHRILSILKIMQKNLCGQSSQKNKVELSRQQIADMSGLRVETVIRAVKKLEKLGTLQIQKGKIYI